MSRDVLIRHGVPTKYDHAAYGTYCKSVNTIGDGFELFIQLSHEEDDPNWISYGNYSHVDDTHIDELIGQTQDIENKY